MRLASAELKVQTIPSSDSGELSLVVKPQGDAIGKCCHTLTTVCSVELDHVLTNEINQEFAWFILPTFEFKGFKIEGHALIVEMRLQNHSTAECNGF